ncbi:glycosyltransferase 1 domain-containing protein 1 isoform X1, partial [Tachysurus ichikawai]
MRLLFLACLSPKTGNCTTAERMRDHIESAGHVCVLRDTRDFSSASDVKLLMSQDKETFDAALAIHLFKGARFLLDAGLPFGVVFGGTDINEDVKDDHKRSVMEEVLHRASEDLMLLDLHSFIIKLMSFRITEKKDRGAVKED